MQELELELELEQEQEQGNWHDCLRTALVSVTGGNTVCAADATAESHAKIEQPV